MALVLHLSGVGESLRLIWEWSFHNQESGDLHEGYTTARDSRAWQGTARRLHNGEGRRGATAMDSTTAQRLHDSEGRSGATAMGCGDGSLTARRLCAGKVICHRLKDDKK
jgi:hypothetical protein